MNHYEVIQLIHPNKGMHVEELIKHHKKLVEDENGKIHRSEDLGRRHLAYLIKKNHKAHYTLMNIECRIETMEKLKQSIYYNDIIMRYLITKVSQPITNPSCFIKTEEQEDTKRKHPKIDEIDYKNTHQLSMHTNETYKIIPARMLSLPAKKQRRIKQAIKRARFLALIPYCDNHKI